ncbi:hypothetical protein DV26_38045 [Amycolatopsis mediterranei]|nr:hypothetical protein DV26_38045 [Amycolatopsis mediterranei]KDU88237.1 hypothetical protein DV36_31985 [Amycolatopsis mediterranei]
MLGVHEGQCALRHAAVQRVGRVLDDGQAAPVHDRPQPGGTVVQRARKDDADDALAAGQRGRPEGRVDRRPMPVLRRSLRQDQRSVFGEQVAVGRRDLHCPRLEGRSVASGPGRQRAHAVENPGQRALRPGAQVHGDQNRGREIGGQPGHQGPQGLDPAGGGTDDHEVTPERRHGVHLLTFGSTVAPARLSRRVAPVVRA